MPFERPRYQFTLLALFGWMILISLFFGLTRLPWPWNSFLAPLYASGLAGYAASRHPWLAAISGGAATIGALAVLTSLGSSRLLAPWSALEGTLMLGGCGCLPIGAYVGLAVAGVTRQHRAAKRFRQQLETLSHEIGNPCPRSQSHGPSPTGPKEETNDNDDPTP